MLHIEPSRLADDSTFSLGTRIFDKLADRTLPRDLFSLAGRRTEPRRVFWIRGSPGGSLYYKVQPLWSTKPWVTQQYILRYVAVADVDVKARLSLCYVRSNHHGYVSRVSEVRDWIVILTELPSVTKLESPIPVTDAEDFICFI